VVAYAVPPVCAAALPPRPPAELAGVVVAEGRCAQLCTAVLELSWGWPQ
jgi:hypothetical protein